MPANEAVKLTVPDGVDRVPEPVSATVTVQSVVSLVVIVVGLQPIAVAVGLSVDRVLTGRAEVCGPATAGLASTPVIKEKATAPAAHRQLRPPP